MSLRILLAEDHAIVREGLRALLRDSGFEVLGEAGDGDEALRLAGSLRPDIAILDISMPRLNGIDAARAIARDHPEVKTVIITVHEEDHCVLDAIRAGVRGYVLKKQCFDELRRAIEAVAHGNVYISPSLSQHLVEVVRRNDGGNRDPLTARERHVLQLVAECQTSKEIAATLGISVKTVETHRANIMAKLDIHETAGLVLYAVRRGMVTP